MILFVRVYLYIIIAPDMCSAWYLLEHYPPNDLYISFHFFFLHPRKTNNPLSLSKPFPFPLFYLYRISSSPFSLNFSITLPALLTVLSALVFFRASPGGVFRRYIDIELFADGTFRGWKRGQTVDGAWWVVKDAPLR